ncbi:MAG: metal ABC transporter ATP-binding protein [bacterium]
MNKQTLLEIRNLTVKISGENIIENITLTLSEGEFLAIVGPNGGGKTTLLKSIIGLIKPSSGSIIINEKIRQKPRWELFGYLPQELPYKRYFPIKAIDVVLLSVYPRLKPFSFPGKKERMRARKYLELMGVAELENEPYFELSVGQKQRVQIARALMNEPAILLLDEPQTGIDIVGQENFYRIIAGMKERRGIIMVTHDIGVVSRYCDSIACLNKRMICHTEPVNITENILNKTYGFDVRGLTHEH